MTRHGHLIAQFALKDFKIRYTHSVLGYAWSVLNPLLFSLIYFLVFSVFVRFDVPHYPGYLLLGITMWGLFAEASTNGVSALMTHAGIIGKVPMPRWIPICAAVVNAFLTFLISAVVLAVLLWATSVPVGWPVLVLPILILDLVVLALGIALLLAPLHVRFHDIGYLWGIGVQIGFWLTPIIYQDMLMPERWRWLITYNPLARLILYARQAVIYGYWPDMVGIMKTTLVAFAILGLGILVFRRLQERVVEYF